MIVNDFSEASADDKEEFNRLVYTRYEAEDLLSNLPSCECGDLTGQYNVGEICSNCGQPCVAPFDQDLEPLVWIRAPQGVRALINPMVWLMLADKFSRSGFEIIRWFCDTTYKPPTKIPPIMAQVQQVLTFDRGWNSFVDNFDAIIDALFFMRSKDRHRLDPLHQLLRDQRHCVFSQYLSLPNRSLLVLEESNMGSYVDPIAPGAVDAIRMMASIDSPLSSFSQRTKENRVVKTTALLAEFYDGFFRTTLAKKEGIYRKHIFGTRSHFSFRAVISSLTNAHRYDEIHVPWGIGLSVFRLHLANKLFKRGYTLNASLDLLNEYAVKYHPLLDELLQQLIDESPGGLGIPVVVQRNPSLERASAQSMFITAFKKDPKIPTFSMSILSVTGFNADFDGDQLNVTLSIDNYTTEELRRLAPHMSTFDLNAPREVSRNLSMPKPVIATVAHFIHHADADQVDPTKLALMEAIPSV